MDQDLTWQGRALLLVLVGLVALTVAYWNSLPLFLSKRRGLWENCHEHSYANSSGFFVNLQGSRNVATPC